MTCESERGVGEIIAAIKVLIDRPTSSQKPLLDRLTHASARLSNAGFQLAVLGQFKRGKTTLLNALLGYPLLSAGVIPLTAIPTFLFGSATMKLRLKYLTGSIEETDVQSVEAFAAAIADGTTEEQNPGNIKGLERVDAGVSFSPWLRDLTLIDTPGIGSTHRHNTTAAHAILTECDAALFVLSVNPPITEVETQYLSTICRTVWRIIVVLNKTDLVEFEDQHNAVAFLASILSRQAVPQLDQRIFPLSARRALAARRDGDDNALHASGVPALEEYIRSDLIDQKRRHIEASIAKKTRDIVAVPEADAALRVRALTVPLGELEEKINLFETAADDFSRERDSLQDLLSGDWWRAISSLEARCDKSDRRARRQLETTILDIVRFSNSGSDKDVIESVMSAVFDKEFETIGTAVEQDLAAAVEVHRKHYRVLAARMWQTAAELMDLPAVPVVSDDWFQITREPYWISHAKIESLSSLTIDALVQILPFGLRRRRHLKQLRSSAERAITRNISGIQWEMRQNIDDSFRRLIAASVESIDESLGSTREALRTAQELRRTTTMSLKHEIERANTIAIGLAGLREQLDTVLRQLDGGFGLTRSDGGS